MSRCFLDTNIVIYAIDRADPAKHAVAAGLYLGLIQSGRGVISTQVLMEYASVALRKLKHDRNSVQRELGLLGKLAVVQVSPDLVHRTVTLSTNHQTSFWDACIIAAAESARCDVIYSEDLNPGQFYAGVQVINPFAATAPTPP